MFRAIEVTLREAVAHPEVFISASSLSKRDAAEFAERAAAHESKWKVEQSPGSPPIWTSPTGNVRMGDPPPF